VRLAGKMASLLPSGQQEDSSGVTMMSNATKASSQSIGAVLGIFLQYQDIIVYTVNILQPRQNQ